MDLSLGGGLWLLTGALSLDVGMRIREIFRVSLLVYGTTPVQVPVVVMAEQRGNFRTFDLATFLTAGACTKGTLYLCGGAVGGARLTNAAAYGAYVYPVAMQGNWAALPELGAYVRGGWSLPARILLSLEVMAGAPLGVATFRVEGIDPPYTTPHFDAVATLRVGVRI